MVCRNSTRNHLLHCLCFFTFFFLFELSGGGIRIWEVHFERDSVDPIKEYGLAWTCFLYLFRFMSILPLPLVICHAIGLVIYNVFPERPQIRGSPLLAPFLSIRVVTRGDYPDLVRKNVQRNMNTCLDLGMDKFLIEVVTDKPINLHKHPRIREIVVPNTYRTKSNAMYKARALQYALEDDVNLLNDDDWIVHLDEETILTENAMRGILNFLFEGKYHIGQGLITYANEEVINWVTTLADSFRVGADMGLLRFCLKKFHKALFIFKGSFVVCQAGVERRVTFDNGVEGSIAEDTYFAMAAMSKGYTFDWIDGEMWEKSPFSFWDFLQQRKRWIQGIFLVVHDRKLPWRSRFCLALALYSWLTLPLSTSNVYLTAIFPIPVGQTLDFLTCLVGIVNLYLYFIGAIKSYSIKRLGFVKFVFCVIGALCTIPFVVVIENIAVIWGLFGDKKKFYVVSKSLKPINQAINVV
jgi:egghead protein (zeste-white 4 protein)